MPDRDRYVYALYGSDENVPCWIGVGKGRRVHQSARQRGGARWRKIVENATLDEAYAVEIALIAHYGRRDLGAGPLLNRNSGGAGAKEYSAETLAKMSVAIRASWTPELSARKSEANRRRVWTAESLKKRSEASKGRRPMLGKKHSAATRAKMSASHKQPECAAIIAEANRNRIWTDESRAKVAAAVRARYAVGHG